MSLRTLIRLLSLSLALALVSPFVGNGAGLILLLAGVALPGLTLACLALAAGGGDLTRWQVRYQLGEDADLEWLEQVLSFLAAKAGHLVLEGNANGLFLEAPAAFDEYLQAQLPRALPEVRLTKSEAEGEHSLAGPSFFSVAQPGGDMLRWATESEGREIRVHVRHGPFVTAVARVTGGRPPGRWLRFPVPRFLSRAWRRLPVWDELSAGARLGSLFPPTGPGAVYSSRSRLLDWTPPAEYRADDSARYLGQSTDGRRLTLSYDLPLLTYGAPQAFLAGQVLQDLTGGYTVIVVSPHRGLLERIALEAEGTPVHWLDPQNPWRSAHLAVVAAEEWAEHDHDDDVVVDAVQGFFAGAGVDIHLPGVGDFTRLLAHVLVSAARQHARDLAFTDFYSIAGGTQILLAALTGLQEVSPDAAELLSQLDGDAGYVQAVTVLSAIRTALRPLGNASFQNFCRAPFLSLSRALNEPSLILAPMTDADFPENDRLLNAMLNLGLTRVLAAHDDRRIALHLHEPDLYQGNGRSWIEAARRDPRLTLLLDGRGATEGNRLEEDKAGQGLFRCPKELAPSFVAAWHLPASPAELAELPAGTAIARLPGMVVALKVSDR